MNPEFHREGDLKDLTSYPFWLQDVVADTVAEKERVVRHRVFTLMQAGQLPEDVARRFLIGVWPTIVQFPQYMASNLRKTQFGRSAGDDLARQYLIHNIRVEQKHADHWMEWAKASGVSLADLLSGSGAPAETHALAHWCWYTADHDPLAVAMAATNYAVEGATGEWACRVCERDDYENSFPEAVRKPGMRWLKVHAHYDDAHPWEALTVVATLLGHQPSLELVDQVRAAILKSYRYMRLTLDHCL